jgi:hypothetical protein
MSALTEEEKRLANRNYAKTYYKKNKEKVRARTKKYKEANREKVVQYAGTYYKKNKEKILDRTKKYKEANREKLAARDRAYYKKNKEKVIDRSAAYYEANKEKVIDRSAAYYEANKENKEKRMLSRAKGRAKRKNLPFNLEVEDVVIPAVCPVLGINLESTISAKGIPQDTSPSLDRIIPELGYVKGNVRVISLRANLLKSNATFEEALLIAEDARKIKGY